MRYAGFWPRLGAGLVDLLVMVPFIVVSFWSLSASRDIALLLEVPMTLLFAFYNIYFVGRWGQTVGKMALGIKVMGLDGTEAGFRRAFYRHCVDLGFSILMTATTVYSLLSVAAAEYDALGFEGKMLMMDEATPSWSRVTDLLYLIWIGSELVVLLLNEKRRALHDFIAGTVVIHTERPAVQASSPS